ncbi:MAG TPA: hypothetical protein VJP41_06785 [Gaiellaceae bacterium]|nr:hypothetical protein [Gaiellaceae bacterium]
MATEAELRREIADERRELTNAVADLRQELGQTADRGKRLGAKVAATTGAAVLARILIRLKRRN